MGKKKWTVSAKRADFGKIAAACGISPILARLIRNRDVVGVDETRLFLEGGLEDLHDPRLLPDAGKAVDLLAEQIKEGKRFRIIGDYDVDGICASYTLWYALRQCGADAMLGHANAVPYHPMPRRCYASPFRSITDQYSSLRCQALTQHCADLIRRRSDLLVLQHLVSEAPVSGIPPLTHSVQPTIIQPFIHDSLMFVGDV